MAKQSTKIKRAAPAPTSEEMARKRIAAKAQEAGIPDAIVPHLVEFNVVDLSGELGGKKNSIVSVLLNRGGSAVDRWINSQAFNLSQERAIRYTQGLWVRADGKLRAVDTTRDRVDEMIDGMSQQEALDELHRFKAQFPRDYWSVYENVCRFDEEAGVAGSKLANNRRSAIDAARTCVGMTSAMIAQWRGF